MNTGREIFFDHIAILKKIKGLRILSLGLLLVIFFSWLVWFQWFSASNISIEVLSGQVEVFGSLGKNTIFTGQTEQLRVSDTALIPQNASILIIFPNGQTLLTEGQKSLSLDSANKFGERQAFVFKEALSGNQFEYNTKSGLDQGSAAILAKKEQTQNPQILGAFESKQNSNHHPKILVWNKIGFCLKLEESRQKENFDYQTTLNKCLKQHNLKNLESLRE